MPNVCFAANFILNICEKFFDDEWYPHIISRFELHKYMKLMCNTKRNVAICYVVLKILIYWFNQWHH